MAGQRGRVTFAVCCLLLAVCSLPLAVRQLLARSWAGVNALPPNGRAVGAALAALASLDTSLETADGSPVASGDLSPSQVCVLSVTPSDAFYTGPPSYRDDHQEVFAAELSVAAARMAWSLRHS